MNNNQNNNNNDQFDSVGCFFDLLGKGCGVIAFLFCAILFCLLICLL